MNIVFTDLFREEIRDKFQISRENVRQAILNPYSFSTVESDQSDLGFYLKLISRKRGDYYLLVCTRRQKEELYVDTAFKILPNLVSEVSSLEPLIVLRDFVNRFGLIIRIGGQENKFIVNERIPIENNITNLTKVVEVLNPLRHSFIQSVVCRMEQEGESKFINCGIAYCIDTYEYRSWLKEYSLSPHY